MSRINRLLILIGCMILCAWWGTWEVAHADEGDVGRIGGHSVVTIALVSDPHIWITTDPRYAAYTTHYKKAITQVNEADVDVVLVSGDLTNSGQRAEFERFMELTERFDAPVLVVAGNHDVGPKASVDRGQPMSETRFALYEELVGALFYVEQIAADVRVIGITASLLGSGLSEEDEQWDFLDRELAEGNQAGMRTILLTHYPLFVNRVDEPDGYSNIDADPRARLLDALKQGEVKLVLSGHTHHPIDHEKEGIRMITAPAVSFGLPFGEQAQGWTLIQFKPHDASAVIDVKKISPPTPARE